LPEREEEDPDFLVEPDNWDAVETFCRCSTQWRIGPMGGLFGLDYPGVESVLKLTLPKRKRGEVFNQIQIMERVALDVMNSKSK
jgi:hypothetical protein